MSFKTREQFNEPRFLSICQDRNCFFCGKDLFDDRFAIGGVVYWSSHGKTICLHQACAENLGVQLIQDARSLSRTVKKCAKLTHEAPQGHDYSETV